MIYNLSEPVTTGISFHNVKSDNHNSSYATQTVQDFIMAFGFKIYGRLIHNKDNIN